MIKMSKLYLAYGSNLNVRQMKFRCPSAKIIGVGLIKNYQLMYKGSKTGSYLTIEKMKGSAVPVAVWEVTDFDERRLDSYEGFPTFYYKKNMMIPVHYFKNGKVEKKKCFAYIMHEERQLGIPSNSYIKCCMEGYDYFGFNKKHLDAAFEISVKGVRK